MLPTTAERGYSARAHVHVEGTYEQTENPGETDTLLHIQL